MLKALKIGNFGTLAEKKVRQNRNFLRAGEIF